MLGSSAGYRLAMPARDMPFIRDDLPIGRTSFHRWRPTPSNIR
jgi:hypothetical protein